MDIAGPRITSFPETGVGADELLAEIDEERAGDIDWRGGRAFSLVYHHDDEVLEGLQHEVAGRFLHENALNPFAYRTLPRMEQEVVLMAGDLFGGEPGAGSLTSGGTESIFLAVQVARDHAREQGIAEPELLTANTAHPAFAKAAKYLDLPHRRIPVADDLRLHGDQVAAHLDENTALVVASAPCYPYGVIDHIPEVAAVAHDAGVLCHVDACLGGWLLPFWERLGEAVPPVGPAGRRRDLALGRRPQVRLLHQGCVDGALRLARTSTDTSSSSTTTGPEGSTARPPPPAPGAACPSPRPGPRSATWAPRATSAWPGPSGTPPAGSRRASRPSTASTSPATPTCRCSSSGPDTLDIGGVGDAMDDRGWHLDRQQGGLHVMLSPGHAAVADRFLADLAASVADHDASRGREATYGGTV